MTNESKGMLLGFIGVLIFSFTLPATRHVAAYLDPFFIGFGRVTIAGIAAAIILIVMKQKIPSKRQLKQLALTSIGIVFGFPIFTSLAMQTVDASHGGVVIAIMPLLTAVIATLFSGERPSPSFWMISLVGTALVTTYSLIDSNLSFQMGDILLLVASVLGAMGYAFGAQISKEMGGWQVICWVVVITLPIVIVPTLMLQPESYAAIPASVWLNFLYLGLMSQLFGFFLWYKGLALGGISRVSQTQLLQPFLIIIISILFLGERFDTTTLIFAIAVVSIIAISRKMPITQADSQTDTQEKTS